MSTYKIGDQVRVYATFKAATFSVASGDPSATYALTDPTAVTLTVTVNGSSTSYTYGAATVSKDSTGVYYKDYTFAASGKHTFQWAGTGAVVAVEATELQAEA